MRPKCHAKWASDLWTAYLTGNKLGSQQNKWQWTVRKCVSRIFKLGHAVESVFSCTRSWKYFRSFCTRRKAAQLRGRRLESCRHHYGGLRGVREAVEHALSVAPRVARAWCPVARSTTRTGGRHSWGPDGAPCRWCLLALFCCNTHSL